MSLGRTRAELGKPPPIPADSPRRRICICTSEERRTGRIFPACLAHPGR